MKKRQPKHWKRSKRFNRHHIKNRCRGGLTVKENILLLDTERHKAFHFLFGNMDFEEVIALLQRVKKIKASLN